MTVQPNWFFFAFLIVPIFLDFGLSIFIALVKRTKINMVFSLFSFFVGMWTLGICAFGLVGLEMAYAWNRVFILSASFIPATFLHFVILFNEERINNFKKCLLYIPCFIFIALLVFSPTSFIKEIKMHDWGKESILGSYYFVFAVYFIVYTTIAILLLFLRMLKTKGILKERYKFILLATLPAFTFGAWFDLVLILMGNYKYIWAGPYFTCSFVIITTYAIAKYRLMDIRLAITNLGLFLFIYSFVLGVPFYTYTKGAYLFSIFLMLILATISPFTYLFIQKRAENKILQDQRRYQSTLRQAATGMGRVKQLKKLLNLVVYVVTRAVHLEHTSIYLRDEKDRKYILSAFKSRKQNQDFLESLPFESDLIVHLKGSNNPINIEFLQQRNKLVTNIKLTAIEEDIIKLKGELILPIHIEDKLLAFIIFGKKESGKAFTDEDLSVFSSLTNQIALAIENAQFYEEVKRTQEQLFQAEKMATIGTMADGLSHQINNRFHAMGFIAGDALDTINITKAKGVPDNLKETFDDLERALNRVQENVVQGGEIVQGLLRYTRKGDAGMTAVDFEAVLKSSFEMAQFKIKTSELKVVHDINELMPKLKGNFTQLQEVFFNLIDNAYDAMMQRKTEKVEMGFQPTLTIRARPQGNFLEIIMEDNGIGVKDDDREKLFTPFFTTKLSSKKGTGLGLYVIRKIIEENHGGTVEMSSKYMIGTKMKVTLPIVF